MANPNYQQALKENENFQECLLLDYWSENRCRDFVLLIDSIWERPGFIRKNLDVIRPFIIRCISCQEIHIDSQSPDFVLQKEVEVNWSIREFAWVGIESRSGIVELQITWEQDKLVKDGRQIRVKCLRIDVEEIPLTSEIAKKYKVL